MAIASSIANRLVATGANAVARSSAEAVKTAGVAGARTLGRTGAGLVGKTAKGLAKLVVVDVSIGLAVDTAAKYSDFVAVNAEAIKIYASCATALGRKGAVTKVFGAGKAALRWAGRGSVPSIFPVSRLIVGRESMMSALKSLKLTRVGEQVKISQGSKTLGTLACTKEGLTFAGKYKLAAAFGALALGGTISKVWNDETTLEDLALLVAALLSDDEVGSQLSKAAALMKQFDPLDLIGSPRFVCEEIMSRCPTLEIEQIFSLLARVRDTVETDGQGGLWYAVGSLDGSKDHPVLSFCGRLLSVGEGNLNPEHGVMPSLHPGTDSAKVSRLTAYGEMLTDVLELAQSDAGMLFHSIDLAEAAKHPSGGEAGTSHLEGLLVSQLFASEETGDDALGVQFVTNGETLAILTENYFPIGEGARLMRYGELTEALFG